ncbi:phytanoyl-CoA dioxygenase family protein [Novosphingobium mathurense]|uniref:Ectoine hydroxylase-related dioxygenase, phytanoyl-CoA dioxygenase (PhyH) family n=1 Tax=Novosphingobium mathurense TaxID=428990 RepID=A0A1U6IL96_9SPHN|nr:phytanoyl-CoA dioxygenase family protein [Novosphingobium mathurense]SLK08784.1 Ectoine hydroxylase-related dioxygenase, phytanoyl-CoA dioxygenase (PhyH) family [Novosphingobium mathurense]
MSASEIGNVDARIEQACAELAREGYCVIPDALGSEAIERLDRDLSDRFARTPFCEGDFYGRRTKRFGGLLNRSPHAEALVRHPLVLGVAERVLGPWCDRIILNLTQAIEIHPGALAQYPHRDQDMWQGPKGEVEYLLNVVWPLSSFTADNGATRLWPMSHRGDAEPMPSDEALAIAMAPGAALLFLGSTLHGGGENRSQAARRGVIISYCLGWLRSFENQYLVYPPETAKRFDPELAALVGYVQHRPNLGNVEGQCPSVLLGGQPIDALPAADALRPDQAEALDRHVAEQAAARAGLLGG